MPPLRPLRRVLVTGGAGFIGSTLLRRLLERPATRVLNYDAFTYAGVDASVAPLRPDLRYEEVRADVVDAAALAYAVGRFDPDVVLHLAAESHVDRSIADPERFVRTNVEGTATLLRVWREHVGGLGPGEAARRLLVHVSTDEVYGPISPPKAARVGDPYRPSSPYSATKAAADHLVGAWRRTYGLSAVIVHPTNNHGPRQFPEKLVPVATLRALRGEPIPLYGDGSQVRDWLHVDDCVAGLIAAAERGEPGATYHLAGGPGDGAAPTEEWSNRRVVEAICDAVDQVAPDGGASGGPRRRLIEHVADRPGHDARYALDSAASRRELGWRPRVALADGLAATVRWYAQNAAWVAEAARAGEGPQERRV
ncbi:dTDP-glucose 4,6-dehydratase [Botrimarina sp.]|uniref:dTDP-glucose 4,6-dehydratase n=1 Tax=Botrimarina sp. TaxID=2795802 RepID=UPI0032EBA4CE